MYMIKFALVTLAAIALLAGIARADEQPAQPHETRRWVQIMLWQGENMMLLTNLPLIAGKSVYVNTGGSGPPVPEGMAPPPIAVEDFIRVSAADSVGNFAVDHDSEYADALQYTQSFTVSNVRFNIYTREADRIGIAIYDEGLSVPLVKPDPDNSFGYDEDSFYKGELESWFIGSIAPATHKAQVLRGPQPPSVTVREPGRQ